MTRTQQSGEPTYGNLRKPTWSLGPWTLLGVLTLVCPTPASPSIVATHCTWRHFLKRQIKFSILGIGRVEESHGKEKRGLHVVLRLIHVLLCFLVYVLFHT